MLVDLQELSSILYYIDPGTGSLIFQFVIAGILSSLFVVKMQWHRIKRIFSRNKKDE